ncbi:MAG TPA: dTDP-4-dehydrorhamnose reductase [Bacteroidales bacterium]|nr:dTDP-4-dehydrorhamnose reductase [Bacteroidales bacterium]
MTETTIPRVILVTGANGQLGNELRVLAPMHPGLQFHFTDVGELDITSEPAVMAMVERIRPLVIINCAAYTAVDRAEQDEEKATLLNGTAPGILARVAGETGALLIHVSTDYIFDGRACTPYAEDHPVAPNSAYGRSKLSGELQVMAHAKQAIILRTSWLYSSFGHNFVKTMMKSGRERGHLRVVFDQAGSPTYARDLADAILQIIESGQSVQGTEVYHYANEGVASWYDFALAIMEISGIPCTVSPILTKEYPLPATRPAYSVFDKAKIKERYGIAIPYWRESLKRCMALLVTSDK